MELTLESLNASINLAWVMLATFLVFWMHAGFTLVESGFVRSKNNINIIMKNFLTITIGPLLYYFLGFGLMFGDTAGGLIGTSGFMLSGRTDVDFFVFQAMFAATCATIISGAVAERIKLGSYIAIMIVMVSFVYPVVGHWIWNGGWLAELGFTDFAGSTVVHMTGAVGALIAVLFLGPRLGKYTGNKVNVIPASNIPLGALGVFILWFGWFGFNGGSTLAADPSLVPNVVATTLLSTSAALVSGVIFTKLRYGKVDATLSLNAVLGGLVGITAGAADISPLGSVIVGLVSGILLVAGVTFLDAKAKVDDPVGAIAVHGICGIWGTLAVGLFSTSTGLFYTGSFGQLGIQAIGVLAVMVWVVVIMTVAIFILNKISRIRVPEKEELAGLDFSEHGTNAYELKETVLEQGATGALSTLSRDYGGHLADRLNQLSGTQAFSK
jgi:Amt family ammonium transporter